MLAKELIQFIEKSVNDSTFLEFLEINNFDTKKLPNQERKKQKAEVATFLLQGIELCFTFENNQLQLYRIIFFKPKSDGLQNTPQIDYPFGLYLNQKKSDYETILGNFVGFDEPQSRDYHFKNYAVTINFEPSDEDKKIKIIEISMKKN